MLYKTLPYFVKELDEKTRTVTGIFAVHGNVDSGGDMSVNGSFEKGLKSGRSRVRFLWNHNPMNPPIASIKNVREVDKSELPAKVLEWAPDATGGVEVTRKYYEGIPLSDWVFKGIQEGDITEMSYAYEVHLSQDVNDPERPKLHRMLLEQELYDISDVNWGMNPATAGVKGLPVPGMTFVQHSAFVETTLEEFLNRVKDRKDFREKEGRTFSDAQRVGLEKTIQVLQDVLKETTPRADQSVVLNEIARFEEFKMKSQGVKIS